MPPSSSTTRTAHPRHRRESEVEKGPLWLRVLVGPRAAQRRDLRGLPLTTVLSLVWWRLGLTATARYRADRFRESALDGRGPSFAVRVARRSVPPHR